MKFTLELNEKELKATINSGLLGSLTEAMEQVNAEHGQSGPAQSIHNEAVQPPYPTQAAYAPAPLAPTPEPATAPQNANYAGFGYMPNAAPGQAPQQYQPQFAPQQPQATQYPQQQFQQPAAGVPTAAPTYTLEQLSVAATQLMDAGKMADLQKLLASFQVPSMMQLDKSQYGNFATQLRALGAKI